MSNTFKQLLLFEDISPKLSDVLSFYFEVEPEKIIHYITEEDSFDVDEWAYDNSLGVADMIDVISRNLNSHVRFSVNECCRCNSAFVGSTVTMTEDSKSLSLRLVWGIDND